LDSVGLGVDCGGQAWRDGSGRTERDATKTAIGEEVSMTSIDQGPEQGLRFEVAQSGAGEPVRLTGELDLSSVPEFYERISELANGGRLVLDLSGLTFLDSSGLRALLQLSQQAKDEGFELALVRPSEVVERLLELTGVDRQLPLVTEA
jgi:anti-anti-sigma factor